MTTIDALLEALRKAGELVAGPERPPAVTGVSDDSRRVEPGHLFCAIVGTADDGHRYVPDAAARGAAAALVTRPTGAGLVEVVVRDGRRATSIAAAEWYGRPADDLTLAAVTGTNGKTTTVHLVRHLLGAAGDAGSIGTLGVVDGGGQAVAGYGALTTPGAVELYAVLAALRARGARTVVLEASSHALDQRRLEGLRLRAAAYTNLTQDHLDYHADLMAYRDAKLRLSALVAPDGVEAVNLDDPAWRALPRRAVGRRVTFGFAAQADVRAADVSLGAEATMLTLVVGGKRRPVTLPLVGEFNVSNAVAAAAVAWGLGMDADAIAARLASAPQVPGRMERLLEAGFRVVRDYAHTPDALHRALAALRPVTRGRLIVLFGAGGDRDRRKRPLMGRAVAAAADLAVVTSDNPRTEDPDAIIDDIEQGMGDAPRVRVTDRREAIRRAVALLEDGDCLLLAGKGHETYQVIGRDRVPFDEPQLVRAALAARSPA